MLGLYGDNGKENGNYYIVCISVYIGEPQSHPQHLGHAVEGLGFRVALPGLCGRLGVYRAILAEMAETHPPEISLNKMNLK